MKTFFLLLFIIFSLQLNLYSQLYEKFKVRLSYYINEDVENSGLVKSYLERELRALGDVELITREEYHETLLALGIEIHLIQLGNEDETLGYVIYAVYFQNYFDKPIHDVYLTSNWVKGSKNDLELMTATIVADFDQQILKGLR